MTWATGLKITAATSVSSMRIVMGLNSAPTGFCIQPLAMRIQSAERLEPSATSAVTSRCWPRESLSQPKKKSPTRVDSRKKAISPSTASGVPKMSPT
ncbi:hypothetical protein D3C84_325990 [compost metagenome]